jgi:BirA family biotin operon repressor/biotin-[acetyl-CoA-carboxylase] ligase
MELDFIILDEAESTNAEAIKLAKLTDRPTFVIAKKQTNGRGRFERRWADPSGNFSGSILIKIDEDLQNLALRSFVTALSVFDAIDQDIGGEHELTIKWPNDILLNGKKICGILLETRNLDNIVALVIGIGINLLSAPNLDEAHKITTEPGSILGETGVRLDPVDLSKSIAHHFSLRENQFRTLGFSKIREIWMERAAKIGEEIIVRTPNSEYQGIFDSIDEKGQLIILKNGEKNKIAAAEIFF